MFLSIESVYRRWADRQTIGGAAPHRQETALIINFASLVDGFVEKVNAEWRLREPLPGEYVPAFLAQQATVDPQDLPDGYTDWRIAKHDNSERIEALQKRTLRIFPPSFQYFLMNYSFPLFDCGPITFFANTGTDVYWELETKLFLDPNMSPHLLRAGFLQIGQWFIGHYDPICFDGNSRTVEHRIVQLDHEEILCNSRVTLVKEIAPSFPDLLRGLLGSDLSRGWPDRI
jgi:hypothetical protein